MVELRVLHYVKVLPWGFGNVSLLFRGWADLW
jgi:hypothetical protein